MHNHNKGQATKEIKILNNKQDNKLINKWKKNQWAKVAK